MSASIQELSAWRDAAPAERKLQRAKNRDYRSREYLTEDEVDAMRAAIRKHSRFALRDELLVLLGFRHGLRVSELIDLRWDQYHRKDRTLYVRRAKGSIDSTHTMEADELRLMNQHRARVQGPFVFLSSRDAPLSYSSARYIIATAAKQAGLDLTVHPHMLRHACGFALANRGVHLRIIQNWLGHTNIQHTVRYTRMAANQFSGIWR